MRDTRINKVSIILTKLTNSEITIFNNKINPKIIFKINQASKLIHMAIPKLTATNSTTNNITISKINTTQDSTTIHLIIIIEPNSIPPTLDPNNKTQTPKINLYFSNQNKIMPPKIYIPYNITFNIKNNKSIPNPLPLIRI